MSGDSKLIRLPYAVFLILHVGILAASCSNIDDNPYYALATGTEGHLVGEINQEAGIFWGVPYTQPPTGEWRWRAPRSPTHYVETYWNATFARPGCPQKCDPLMKKYICAPTTSEDCLYLNVFVPRRTFVRSNTSEILPGNHYVLQKKFITTESESLAVMVFLHGGNFLMGSGSAVLYDGRFLANRRDVIVVTINYRLSAIGFLAQGSGDVNFGILDQIQALKWVKENIAAFGGSQNKITLVGQSAGAESVGILMTSQYGKDLFQQAVIQSDPWSLPYRTLPEAKRFGDKLARALKCQPRNMTCLRLRSADAVIEAGGEISTFSLKSKGKILYAFQEWAPIIDGDLIPKLPLDSFLEGKYHDMPVLIGTDRDDGFIFIDAAFPKPLPKLIYSVLLGSIARTLGPEIIEEYPPCNNCDNRRDLNKIATDYTFVCPSRRVLCKLGTNTWSYVFDAILPWKGLYKDNICMDMACHGNELPYIFNPLPLTNLTFTDAQKRLSDQMQLYWTNFIKYGNPNGKENEAESHLTEWKQFKEGYIDTYNILELRITGNAMLRSPSNSTCNFWDELDPYGKY